MNPLDATVIDLARAAGVGVGGVAVDTLTADLPLVVGLRLSPAGAVIEGTYPGLTRLGTFDRPLGRLRITLEARKEPS